MSEDKVRKYPHRVSFEIEGEIKQELDALVAWGLRSSIYTNFTEQLIYLIKTHGNGVLIDLADPTNKNNLVAWYEKYKGLENKNEIGDSKK
jgi:hypothetical protein